MVLVLLAGCGGEYWLKAPDSEALVPVAVQETFQQAPLPGLDVLFVVDGTGSMAEEQADLAAAARDFLYGLSALSVSWQVGVISTDRSENGVLRGQPWILTAATPGAEEVLAESLAVGTEHLPPSAGMAMAFSALQPDVSENYGFRREDAALQVVFVSDGNDDSSTEEQSRFLAWMQEEATASGRKAQASAVVGDVPGGCNSTRGQALAGTAYVEVAHALGGVVQSICSPDFVTIAQMIGDQGVEWTKEFVLQAVPDKGSVVVTVDEVRTTAWELDGQTLRFEEAPLPDATIVVEYTLGAG